MSHEVIPKAFSHSFSPLDKVDHELVRLYTQSRILNGRGAAQELQQLFATNRYINPDLLLRLMEYGKFVEPYNDDMTVQDDDYMRMRTFNAGAALALATTSTLAFELDIDQFEWRVKWASLPANLDAPLNVKIEQASSRDCFKIGAAIMEIGHRNLASLEHPYRAMVSEVDAIYGANGSYSNIFQASYGYVFGVGRRVVRDIAYDAAIEEVVKEAIPDADDLTTGGRFDIELRAFLAHEAMHG